MEPILSLIITNGLYSIFFFGLGVIGGFIIIDETSYCLDYIFNREDNQDNRIRDFTKRTYTE